jgi:hypothetical protein
LTEQLSQDFPVIPVLFESIKTKAAPFRDAASLQRTILSGFLEKFILELPELCTERLAGEIGRFLERAALFLGKKLMAASKHFDLAHFVVARTAAVEPEHDLTANDTVVKGGELFNLFCHKVKQLHVGVEVHGLDVDRHSDSSFFD